MEQKITALKADGPRFISSEQVNILRELKNLCYYPTIKERKEFITKVCKAAGADRFSNILDENFGTAFLTAETILHKRGESVFKPQQNLYIEETE